MFKDPTFCVCQWSTQIIFMVCTGRIEIGESNDSIEKCELKIEYLSYKLVLWTHNQTNEALAIPTLEASGYIMNNT